MSIYYTKSYYVLLIIHSRTDSYLKSFAAKYSIFLMNTVVARMNDLQNSYGTYNYVEHLE